MAKVRFFGRVSDVTQGQRETMISGETLRETLERLKELFGHQFAELVLDETGNIRPFINIFVNKKNMNQLQGLDTEIGDEDEILIIPAVAGG